MSRSLTGFVTVAGPDRRRTTFGPGDDVPAWAAAQITNPAAWTGEELSSPKVETPNPPAPAALKPPPQGGKGSGVNAWRAYAVAMDVPHDEGDDRDELIEACREAGVPVD